MDFRIVDNNRIHYKGRDFSTMLSWVHCKYPNALYSVTSREEDGDYKTSDLDVMLDDLPNIDEVTVAADNITIHMTRKELTVTGCDINTFTQNLIERYGHNRRVTDPQTVMKVFMRAKDAVSHDFKPFKMYCPETNIVESYFLIMEVPNLDKGTIVLKGTIDGFSVKVTYGYGLFRITSSDSKTLHNLVSQLFK